MTSPGGALRGPEDSSLDSLARELASGQLSRRGALARLGAAAVSAAVPSFLLAEASLAACPESRKCGKRCCPKGARCRKGKCKCRGGKRKCGRRCVDVRTDPTNCGTCGNACAAGQTCVEGQCVGGQTPPEQPPPENPPPAQTCGNGIAEGTEQCDGSDLEGATCASLGLGVGTLACSPNCTFDTSGCSEPPVCGNDVQEPGEECDGDDLGGATCVDLGFVGGALACFADCSYDTGACAGAECQADEECPDTGNECTFSVCNGGFCEELALTGTPCDDGNACTQSDVCQAGTCVGQDPVVCQPLSECHIAGTCDPATGACSNPTAPIGTPCPGGTCVGGVCVS